MHAGAWVVLTVLLLTAACSDDAEGPQPRPSISSSVPSVTLPSPSLSATVSPSPSGSPSAAPARPTFDIVDAVATVNHLAGVIGPREATGAAYQRAAAWVARRFTVAGYQVRRPPVGVPAGHSWGVPVPDGTSWNVIATPPGFDPRAPYLVVGAHLDTVPQSPGAEDNASGVAVLLAAADRFAPRGGQRPRLPTVFVAFGAEEPRGPGDDRHHYGSRAYVATLGPAERAALRGMVSLDRVGVGRTVPVCTASPAGQPLRAQLVAAAGRAGVAIRACTNRSSDHWSFARNGLAGIRIGSTPYAAYHSAADRPGVVQRAQLDRVGRLLVSWLS